MDLKVMHSGIHDRNSHFIIADIFLLSFAFYVLILSGLNAFDVSQARIDVLSSLTNNFDLNVRFNSGVKGIDGRDYSWFGIGSVLLGLPLYLFGKLLGIEPAALMPLVNVIISAATNCLVYLFTYSLGYSKRISVTISLIYGFTTMACYYAKDPGDQSIETFFILLSVYCMYRHIATGKTTYAIYSAFSIGMAIITRINAVIAIPAILTLPLLEYLFSDYSQEKLKQLSRCIGLFIAGLVPFALLFMWYNYYRYGSVLETGYGIMASKWGIPLFGTSPLTGLTGLLLSPGKGVFYYSPPALFFFISIRRFAKPNLKIAFSFTVLILSYFVFFAKYSFWHGDWAWGPRFVLATIPYFIIPLASILYRPSKKLKAFIISGLVLGMAIQLLAISINPYRYFIDLQLHENIQFTVVRGEGVQPIQLIPSETYLNWRKSPILYHLKFFHDSANGLSKFNYVKNSNGITTRNYVLSEPYMNTFDFQWLYSNYIIHTYNGFYIPFLTMIVLCFCGKNLYNHSKNESNRTIAPV